MNKYINVCYSKNISWGQIKDEVFVFDESNGKIYILRNGKKELWLLLNQYNDIDLVCNYLVNFQQFNKEDIYLIIEQLINKNLLRGKKI